MNAAPAICRVARSRPPDAAKRARRDAICASASAPIDRFDPAFIPVHLNPDGTYGGSIDFGSIHRLKF
jgi:hypothetical protein